MNSFDQAGTAPRVGLIELPDLADLLARSGVAVVSGANFREAATNVKDASASSPLPLIIGDRPTSEDGRPAPGINTWAKKMSAQHRVAVIRNHTENTLAVEKAVEITLPTTLNTILASLGLPPLAADAAYPAGAQAPAPAPVPAEQAAPAPAAPAQADSVAPGFFDAPAQAPAPEAPAPAPAAPAADFYAPPAAAPVPEAPTAQVFEAAPAAPAGNDFYAPPAAAPAVEAPAADSFYAPPAPAPEAPAAPAADFYAPPAAAPAPEFQAPAAPADSFYATPAAAPASEAPAPAADFYAPPAAAPAPEFQAPAPADNFYAPPAAAPAFEAPAPAADSFYAPPAAAPAPEFQTPAAPASDFFAAPAPAAPGFQAQQAPFGSAHAPAFETPAPAAPAANDFFNAAPAPAAPGFQAQQAPFGSAHAPAFETPAPAAPAANDFFNAVPAPAFETPAPAAPAANDFFNAVPAPAFETPAPAAPAANDFFNAAPAPAPAPAAPGFQAQPQAFGSAPAFEAAPTAPAQGDFFAGTPAPAAPAQDFYSTPSSFTAAPAAPANEDAFFGNTPSAPAFGGAPAAPMVQQAPMDMTEGIDRHQAARRRSAGHSTTHLANVIICIAGKGGVGKTTTAVSLAQIAAEAGLKVILVDGNVGQADLRTYLRTANSDLPTIYDAAIGRESAIVGPGALNGVRRPEQGKVGFGFVAGPPHDASIDQYVVTNQDYIKVIHEARQKVDLVILDTQILEARDDSGFVSDVVQPLLMESAFALGIADMSTPGVKRLNERLQSLINHGTPRDRIMIMINNVPQDQMAVADNGQRYFERLGNFVGAVPTNVEEIHDVMNAGSVPSSNRDLRTVLTDVLARSTGADVFNAVPEEPEPATEAKGGLFSRMFKKKAA